MVQIPFVIAQTTPALPSWLSYVAPFVGGVGLALGYERWVVENRVQAQKDRLENELADERRKREHWERLATEAAKDADAAFQALQETLGDISEQDISSNDVVRLSRILGKLKKWSSLDKELSDYKIAAKELKSCPTSLFKRSAHRSIKDHKDKIPELQEFLPWKRQEKIQQFQCQVMRYVDWVYDCLYVTGHPDNNPLSRFVSSPVFSSVEPYTTAITYVKEQGDWGQLTIEQAHYLNLFFDELLIRLPEEFPRN